MGLTSRHLDDRYPPARTRRHDRRGVVLILTMLGVVLMVSLIFFVYNISHAVSQRVKVQNAADSVAVSGAGWMARSMNVLAMNNCAQSRMLALVPVFDSLPLASEMALAELTSWVEMTDVLSGNGVDNPSTFPPNATREALANLHSRLEVQRAKMEPFEDVVNNAFDMRRSTFWRHPDGMSGSLPHGSFWRSAVALEEFSLSTILNAERLAQSNAIRYGQANEMDGAYMLPLVPYLPAKAGVFEDFQTVLMTAIAVDGTGAEMRDNSSGGAIPDMEYPHRLGPFARLFNWRYDYYYYMGGIYVPPPESTVPVVTVRHSGRNMSVPQQTGRWVDFEAIPAGYRTYGPFQWALNKVGLLSFQWTAEEDGEVVELTDDFESFFDWYVRNLARIKLAYMFTDEPPVTELMVYHYPEWVAQGDYDEAQKIASEAATALPGQLATRVHRTMVFEVFVASLIKPGEGGYLADRMTYAEWSWELPWITRRSDLYRLFEKGSYWTNVMDPMVMWHNGWYDLATAHRSGQCNGDCTYTQNDANSWEHTFHYTQQVGIDAATDEPITVEVYVTELLIFGGIDVGGDVEVRNPCNYTVDAILPIPFLYEPGESDEFDYTDDPDIGARREYFTFLGVTSKESKAPVWPVKFKPGGPIEATVGIAQAKLFNHSSWDLWTQDWQVQLTPVTKWEDWLEEMNEAEDAIGNDDPDLSDALDTSYFLKMTEYFHTLEPDMMNRFLSH